MYGRGMARQASCDSVLRQNFFGPVFLTNNCSDSRGLPKWRARGARPAGRPLLQTPVFQLYSSECSASTPGPAPALMRALPVGRGRRARSLSRGPAGVLY